MQLYSGPTDYGRENDGDGGSPRSDADPDGSAGSGKKLQRPVQRSAQACSQCRSHKIRCVPPDAEHPFPCTRCIAQNITCEVLKHNRGRKRKQATGEPEPTPKRQSASYFPTDGVHGGPSTAPSSSNRSTPDNGNLHVLEQAIAMQGGTPDGAEEQKNLVSPHFPPMPSFLHSPHLKQNTNKQPYGFNQPMLPLPLRSQPPLQVHMQTHYQPSPSFFQSMLPPRAPSPGPSMQPAQQSIQQQHQQPPRPYYPPHHLNSIVEQTPKEEPSALPPLPTSDLNTSTSTSTQNRADPENLEQLKFPFLIPRGDRHGRRGMFSLTSLMPPDQVEEIGPPGPAMSRFNEASLLTVDPIQAGVLNVDDARTLFKLYMDEMSVMNCLLDPTVHTHDFVRSKSSFLYTAILSVISRYLNGTTYAADGSPKRLISPVYAYCKQAAKAHLKSVLGNIETSLEVIQGLAILTFHKDPEDEKACLNLYRAIAIAREIGLDQVRPTPDMTEDQSLWARIKQRVWLSLFVANTILTQQFDMNLLIGADDPAVAASSRFAIGSALPTDTLLCASIQLRRLYHIYTDMARAMDAIGASPSDKAARLVSLSVLTRTANRELEQTARDWKEECASVGLVRIDSKIDVWLAAIKLKFNLIIVQMSLPGLRERGIAISGSFLPPSKQQTGDTRRGASVELGCIGAWHHCISSACFILQAMTALGERRLLSFAADTFLSFSIYSAFFLWTLCRDVGPAILEPGEVEHCFVLISSATRALDAASMYPGDSPALHAQFLRNLSRTKPRLRASHGGTSTFSTDFAQDSMRNRQTSPETPVSNKLNIHPSLEPVLAQMQPPGYNTQPQQNTRMQNIDTTVAPFSTTDFDAMLMADWNSMQRDFPWAFSEAGAGVPFLQADQAQTPAHTQQYQPVMPQQLPGYGNGAFPPRNASAWP